MASNMYSKPPKYEDIMKNEGPLYKVAVSITQLVGDLKTHVKSLESLEKAVDEEKQTSSSPSAAFKLNDLHSLVHGVLLKVRSYKRGCDDVAKFGDCHEGEEMQTEEEMLSFIQELNSFPSILNKRLEALITETDKAMSAVRELKASTRASRAPNTATDDAARKQSTHTTPPNTYTSGKAQVPPSTVSCDTPPNQTPPIGSRATRDEAGIPRRAINWVSSLLSRASERFSAHEQSQNTCTLVSEKCEREFSKLSVEAKRLKTVVATYSENIETSLETWPEVSDAGRHSKRLCEGIGKIKTSCSQLRIQLADN